MLNIAIFHMWYIVIFSKIQNFNYEVIHACYGQAINQCFIYSHGGSFSQHMRNFGVHACLITHVNVKKFFVRKNESIRLGANKNERVKTPAAKRDCEFYGL